MNFEEMMKELEEIVNRLETRIFHSKNPSNSLNAEWSSTESAKRFFSKTG